MFLRNTGVKQSRAFIKKKTKLSILDRSQILSNEFKKNLEEEAKKIKMSRSSKLTKQETEEVVMKLAEKYSLTEEQALAFIAVLFQQGGTAKSASNELCTEMFGKKVTLGNLRSTLKECKLQNSERKLARALAPEIFEICLLLNEIPGNLHKKVIRENPDCSLSKEELCWLSDFQSDNENCPRELSKLINATFNRTQKNKK